MIGSPRGRQRPRTKWIPPTCPCGKGKVKLPMIIRLPTSVGVVEMPAKGENGDPKRACDVCYQIYTIIRPNNQKVEEEEE